MTQPLNFRAERGSTSWERADATAALIERCNPYGYIVTLPDGQVHTVTYARDDGAYVGRCDCKGWEYRDDPHSPCTHLATLRKAEFAGMDDVGGRPITAVDPDDEHDDVDLDATTSRAVATDGGHVVAPPAGADERTFGRPEGQQ
jgi:hypothetical protein